LPAARVSLLYVVLNLGFSSADADPITGEMKP
jgi:hypothetical protein